MLLSFWTLFRAKLLVCRLTVRLVDFVQAPVLKKKHAKLLGEGWEGGRKARYQQGFCSNYLPIMVLLAILVDFIKKCQRCLVTVFSKCPEVGQ